MTCRAISTGFGGLRLDGGAGERWQTRAPAAVVHLAARQLPQQVSLVARDQVDDPLLQRLLVGDGDAGAHGLLGPVGVVAFLGRQAADVGGGVVGDLLGHRRVQVGRHPR